MSFWVWFWSIFFFVSLAIYIVVVVTVAVGGFLNIRSLLRKLSERAGRSRGE